jgi:predicted N-acetyltransferase YhbS
MAMPVSTVSETRELHDADRKHPEFGFILALVCLALGLVVASVMFTPQAVGGAMNTDDSLLVGP